MQEYDIALKALLRASAASVVRQVSGESVSEWLDTETPEVKTSRVDLLGVTTERHLLHVELQSSNDSTMALRMAVYCLHVYRQHKRFPRQIVLYVGDAPLRMKASLTGPDLTFRYSLFDIRTLDGSALLASPSVQDNLLAVLTRLPDRLDVVREILARIAKLELPAMREAFAQFLIISGLRKLAPTVREEAQKMPILNDILDHEVIGPAIRQGLQQGLKQGLEQGLKQGLEQGMQQGMQQGLEQGMQRGVQKGRKEILQRLLEKRFGPLPNAIETRLSALSESQLDELALRLLDADNLEELFSA